MNDEEEEFEIRIDADLTKLYQISGTTTKEITFDSLKKDSYVIVTGVINDKTVDANSILSTNISSLVRGKVGEVKVEDFFLKVLTNDKETYTLDIETFTKQQIVNIKTLVLERMVSQDKGRRHDHFVVKKTGLEQEHNRFRCSEIFNHPPSFFWNNLQC